TGHQGAASPGRLPAAPGGAAVARPGAAGAPGRPAQPPAPAPLGRAPGAPGGGAAPEPLLPAPGSAPTLSSEAGGAPGRPSHVRRWGGMRGTDKEQGRSLYAEGIPTGEAGWEGCAGMARAPSG